MNLKERPRASALVENKERALAESEESDAVAAENTKKRAESVILSGNVQKGVLLIALPSVATMLLQTTNGFLDRFFIKELGPNALAAVTTANSLQFAIMSAAMAISVGTTALVARAVGENKLEDAEKATQQSLILAFWVSFAVAALMWFARYPLLNALITDAAARELTESYLGVTLLGLPSLFLMLILNGAFRGLGDTVRPFWVSLGANVIHGIFNYLLIFGKFGFPRMGLPGGATALVISQTVAMGLYFFFMRSSILQKMKYSVRLDKEWAKRIGRIGLPASAQQLIRVGSMLSFQSLLSHNGAGSAAIAALGVGLISESMAFMPGFGYSIAASAYVGQNLGANQPERAKQGAWAATWQAVGVMTFMGVIFYVFAEPFAHIFLSQREGVGAEMNAQIEETFKLTVMYLRTAAFAEPFLALGMVLTGALQGAGETKSPTWLTIFTMVFVRLPLAWVLMVMVGWGTHGAWWAMSLSTILQGILTVVIFQQGGWLKQRV